MKTGVECHHMVRVRLRRRSRLPIVAVAALGLATWLVGCGSSTRTLNNQKVEQALAQSLLTKRHLYARVGCPAAIPAASHHSFRCTALFDAGKAPIEVTETNSRGDLRWSTGRPLVALDMAHITSAIGRALLVQRHAKAAVTCPSEVLQRQRVAFTCTAVVRASSARIKRGSYPFRVVEVDNHGHVTFAGH